jgi:hypothetical protein
MLMDTTTLAAGVLICRDRPPVQPAGGWPAQARPPQPQGWDRPHVLGPALYAVNPHGAATNVTQGQMDELARRADAGDAAAPSALPAPAPAPAGAPAEGAGWMGPQGNLGGGGGAGVAGYPAIR